MINLCHERRRKQQQWKTYFFDRENTHKLQVEINSQTHTHKKIKTEKFKSLKKLSCLTGLADVDASGRLLSLSLPKRKALNIWTIIVIIMHLIMIYEANDVHKKYVYSRTIHLQRIWQHWFNEIGTADNLNDKWAIKDYSIH